MTELFETLSLILARDVAVGNGGHEGTPDAGRETQATATNPQTRGSTAQGRSRLRFVPVRRARALVLGR